MVEDSGPKFDDIIAALSHGSLRIESVIHDRLRSGCRIAKRGENGLRCKEGITVY